METHAQHHESHVLACQAERGKLGAWMQTFKAVFKILQTLLQLMPIMKMCSDRLMNELEKHEAKELQLNK